MRRRTRPEGGCGLENRRVKVELYGQIQREYEHGAGTIKGVAKKVGDTPADGPGSPGQRDTARAAEAGHGDPIQSIKVGQIKSS